MSATDVKASEPPEPTAVDILAMTLQAHFVGTHGPDALDRQDCQAAAVLGLRQLRIEGYVIVHQSEISYPFVRQSITAAERTALELDDRPEVDEPDCYYLEWVGEEATAAATVGCG